jgi:signal transduction histidine kinase
MTKTGFQILLVEDNTGDAVLLKGFLAQSPIPFDVKHTMALGTAVEQLTQEQPDAVLLDLGLPDSQGLETLNRTKSQAPNTPVVVLTGLNDSETALKALQSGAQDYLVKGTIESGSLAQSLRYAIERQRLQAEIERVQVQQIALRDEFLSHVSHELRSPLNAIYQFVTILADGLAGECNPQQQEFLVIISRNVRQLKSMIGELLDVTRAGAGKLVADPQATEVGSSVEDAIQTVQCAATAKQVSLSSEVPGDVPAAHADPDRLRQILVNLLENGVKFTPSGGKVTLSVDVQRKAKNSVLRFRVTDSGCGINPEHRERIFERLYQVTGSDGGRNGLGLGLYICKELIKLQGGEIWVERSSPEGTTFCFTLPIHQPSPTAAPN